MTALALAPAKPLALRAPTSKATFVLARQAGGRSARPVYEELKARKILVRYFDTARLGDSLRITVGTDAEIAALLDALGDIRRGATASRPSSRRRGCATR